MVQKGCSPNQPLCKRGHDFTITRRYKPNGRGTFCYQCHVDDNTKRHYAKKDGRNRGRQVRKFGITDADYDRMLEQQGGVCKICGGVSNNKALAVDHCHTTGHVRGLLCSRCNISLGGFKDDTELLHNAILYLTSARERYAQKQAEMHLESSN